MNETEREKRHSVAAPVKEKPKDRGFAGELTNIQLDSLIQLYCLSAETVAITIQQGDYSGTVYLENGEIVHAKAGPRSGEEAFYTIMALQGGRIETSQTMKAEERTIQKNYQFLLMEVARLNDESSWIEATEADGVFNTGQKEPTHAVKPTKLKAVVVDDSTMMRKIITRILASEGDIEISATAANGKEALARIAAHKPDVVALDANMPVMDGLSTLKHIMITFPCPVVIMSNLADGDQAMLAPFFNFGAVDFLPKPVGTKDMLAQQQNILASVRTAAKAKVERFRRCPLPQWVDPTDKGAVRAGKRPFVLLVAGLGGYHEMLHVLAGLPAGLDVYLAAFQGLPVSLMQPFAACASNSARIATVPVDSEKTMEPGCCYVASLDARVRFQQAKASPRLFLTPAASIRSGKGRPIDDFIRDVVDQYAGSVHAVFLSGVQGIARESLDAIRRTKGKIIVQDPSR